MQSGVNLLAASSVKSSADVEDLREFLLKNNGEGVKLFIRIHTKSAYNELDKIISLSDGIIFTHGMLHEVTDDPSVDEFTILEKCKMQGKPFVCCFEAKTYDEERKKMPEIVNAYKQR